MVPLVKDRPARACSASTTASPGGGFLQKNLPKGAPDWLSTTVTVPERDGTIAHRVESPAPTRSCGWPTRTASPRTSGPRAATGATGPTGSCSTSTRPTTTSTRSATAALAVADMLRELGLTPFAKAERLARDPRRGAAQAHARWRTRCGRRRGRAGRADRGRASGHADDRSGARRSATAQILVDVARNTYGQTVVAAVRGARRCRARRSRRPSTWDEVADPKLTPQAFALRTIDERLRKAGDPWADIAEHAQTLPANLLHA